MKFHRCHKWQKQITVRRDGENGLPVVYASRTCRTCRLRERVTLSTFGPDTLSVGIPLETLDHEFAPGVNTPDPLDRW